MVGRVARVGIPRTTKAAGFANQWDAFRQGLRGLGWIEGRDVLFEVRFADNQHERLPLVAAELVAVRVEVVAISEEAKLIANAAPLEGSNRPTGVAVVGMPPCCRRGLRASISARATPRGPAPCDL